MRRKLRVGKRRGVLIAVLAALAGAVLLVGCGGSGSEEAAAGGGGDGGSAEPIKLTVGLSTGSMGSHEYFAAKALGYYADEGLDVKLVATGGSPEVVQQLVAGNFDLGTAGADVVMAGMQTQPLYPFFPSLKDYRDWVVPEDSPIQSVADLKGTTLGVPNLSDGSVPIGRYLLEHNHLEPDDDVQIVAAGSEAASVASSLEQKRIQSYLGAQSEIAPLTVQAGIKVRSIYPSEIKQGYVEYAVASQEMAQKKDVLAKFARATAKAELYCATNADACLEAVGKEAPELVQNEKVAHSLFDIYSKLVTPTDKVDGKLHWGHMDPSTFKRYLAIFSQGEKPLITQPDKVDLDKYLITGLEDQINDFDYDAVVQQAKSAG